MKLSDLKNKICLLVLILYHQKTIFFWKSNSSLQIQIQDKGSKACTYLDELYNRKHKYKPHSLLNLPSPLDFIINSFPNSHIDAFTIIARQESVWAKLLLTTAGNTKYESRIWSMTMKASRAHLEWFMNCHVHILTHRPNWYPYILRWPTREKLKDWLRNLKRDKSKAGQI